MNEAIKKPSIWGCLPKALFLELFVLLLALAMNAILGGPKIGLEQSSAQAVFFVLIALFLAITFWGLISLLSTKQALGRQTAQLEIIGPYKYARHPIYSAIVFLLNPALAFLLRSWVLLFACLIIWLIWKSAIGAEEKELGDFFGDDYKKYQRNTWSLFPNLLKINKLSFLGSLAVAVFLIIFIGLNFSSLYSSAVEISQGGAAVSQSALVLPPSAQTQTAMVLPTGLPQTIYQPQISRPQPKYNQPNSIFIAKINITAPLVSPANDSQKELNVALNKGVLIYPGSALPGQNGNLFLTGHSSTYIWNKTPYGRIFSHLDKLEAGDIITVYYNQYKYDYRVVKKYETSSDKVTTGSSILTNEQTITLSTCWPPGTTLKRLLVEGVIVE